MRKSKPRLHGAEPKVTDYGSRETQTGDNTTSQSSAQGSYLLVGNSQAAPATSSTIRNELDEPGDEAIQ